MEILVNAVLWILPFLLLVPFLIVFCILGAKRGPARAAISVAATAVSAAAAYFLAKLFSGIAAKNVEGVVLSALDFGESAFSTAESALPEVLTGILKQSIYAFLKPVFFVPALLLTGFAVKLTVSLICDRKMKRPDTKGQRTAGSLIAAGDAVLFLLLLNLPIYGTLNMVCKAAPPVLKIAEENDGVPEEVIRLFDSVSDNGIVRLYGNPACEKAYALLTAFRYDGDVNSLSALTRDGSAFLTRLSTLSSDSDPEDIAEVLAEGKELVKKHPFIADYTCDLLASVPDDPEKPYLEPLRKFAGETKKAGNQQENISALLSAVLRVIGTGTDLNDFRAAETITAIAENDELINGITADLNATKELSTLKNDLIVMLLDRSFGENAPEALKNLTGGFRPLTGDEIKEEARSFRMILSAAASMTEGKEETSANAADLIEGLARHPLIGPEKTVEVISDLLVTQEDSALQKIASGSSLDGVKDALRKSVSGENGSFRSYLGAAEDAANALSEVGKEDADPAAIEKLLGTDPDVLLTMKDCVTSDLLIACGTPEELAEKSEGMVGILFEEMAEASGKGTDTAKESAAILEVLNLLQSADGSEAQTLTDVIPDPEGLFDRVISSEVLTGTVSRVIRDENGASVSDPLGCFGTMTDDAKNELKDRLEKYGADKPETTDRIEELKQFFGLS